MSKLYREQRVGFRLAPGGASMALCLALSAGCGGPPTKMTINMAVSPVAGSADTHCQLADGTTKIQKTDLSMCQPEGVYPHDHSSQGDGSYGDPHFNTEAADDGCKYWTRLTVAPELSPEGANFRLEVTRLADGQAAQSALIGVEAYLNEIHPARTFGIVGIQSQPGVYTLGPIDFDAEGRWTIRFHLYEDCSDEADSSPHSHVAYYLGAS